VVATLVLAPFALPAGGSELTDPEILVLGAMVGLLSSVLPYSAELMALRRIRPDVFSILMSLEPAAAALAAMVVLQEFLSLVQWVAVASVMVASVGATRSRKTIGEPVPD
jgi:inner membrane transporter RhtA